MYAPRVRRLRDGRPRTERTTAAAGPLGQQPAAYRCSQQRRYASWRYADGLGVGNWCSIPPLPLYKIPSIIGGAFAASAQRRDCTVPPKISPGPGRSANARYVRRRDERGCNGGEGGGCDLSSGPRASRSTAAAAATELAACENRHHAPLRSVTPKLCWNVVRVWPACVLQQLAAAAASDLFSMLSASLFRTQRCHRFLRSAGRRRVCPGKQRL